MFPYSSLPLGPWGRHSWLTRYRSVDTPAGGARPASHAHTQCGGVGEARLAVTGEPKGGHVTSRHLAPAGNAGGTGFYLATGSLIP